MQQRNVCVWVGLSFTINPSGTSKKKEFIYEEVKNTISMIMHPVGYLFWKRIQTPANTYTWAHTSYIPSHRLHTKHIFRRIVIQICNYAFQCSAPKTLLNIYIFWLHYSIREYNSKVNAKMLLLSYILKYLTFPVRFRMHVRRYHIRSLSIFFWGGGDGVVTHITLFRQIYIFPFECNHAQTLKKCYLKIPLSGWVKRMTISIDGFESRFLIFLVYDNMDFRVCCVRLWFKQKPQKRSSSLRFLFLFNELRSIWYFLIDIYQKRDVGTILRVLVVGRTKQAKWIH